MRVSLRWNGVQVSVDAHAISVLRGEPGIDFSVDEASARITLQSAAVLLSAIEACLVASTSREQRPRAALRDLIPHGGDGAKLALLSRRERQVLQLLASGLSVKAAALKLSISGKTIDVHKQRLLTKLNLDGIADMTRFAVRNGLVGGHDV